MIIWRGWGILAAVIPFILFLVTEIAVDSAFGAGTYSNSGWLFMPGLLAAALILWPLGRRLNSGGRAYIDMETGEQLVARPNHSLFFIKMEYWAFILPVLGVVLTLSM